MKTLMIRTACVAAALALGVESADAQPFATLRWQLQPLCHVLTLAVTTSGPAFRLEGTDDQCGQSPAAVFGTAFPNPDGTIGLGMTIVIVPEAVPLHIDATIELATLNGTWRDSSGASGAFVATPGPGSGGDSRIVNTTLGIGVVDTTQIQRRVSTSCPAGSSANGVSREGALQCIARGGSSLLEVVAGTNVAVSNGTADAAVTLAKTATGALSLGSSNLVMTTPAGDGQAAASGPGHRFLWHPGKRALRAGGVVADHWDEGQIGTFSAAFGSNARAIGSGSLAMGLTTTATGDGSVAIGIGSAATGFGAVAIGHNNSAEGEASLALGEGNIARGAGSVTLGYRALTTPAAIGTFLFVDRSSSNGISVSAPNAFLVRAAGGSGFYSKSDNSTGVELPPGSGTWESASDVNLKHDFRTTAGETVLRKLAKLPVQEWSYRSQPGVRHVGPTAQAFKRVFDLGASRFHINAIDADGVALAAAKAIAARAERLEADNQELARRVAELRVRLARLEREGGAR